MQDKESAVPVLCVTPKIHGVTVWFPVVQNWYAALVKALLATSVTSGLQTRVHQAVFSNEVFNPGANGYDRLLGMRGQESTAEVKEGLMLSAFMDLVEVMFLGCRWHPADFALVKCPIFTYL